MTDDARLSVPIPLRALFQSQGNQMIVSVETTQGYSYRGVLESVDSFMNMKLQDVEVSRVRKLFLVDNQLSGSSSFAVSSTSNSNSTLVRENTVTTKCATSVCIRGESILFVGLPTSLEADIKETTKSVKKLLVEKARKAKVDVLQKRLNQAKQTQRESGASNARKTMEDVRAVNKKLKTALKQSKRKK